MLIHGKYTLAYKQFLRLGRADPKMTVVEFVRRCGR